MADDIKSEVAFASGMGEFVCRRSSQRNAAESERAKMAGGPLLAVSVILAHHTKGIELFKLAFGYTEEGCGKPEVVRR